MDGVAGVENFTAINRLQVNEKEKFAKRLSLFVENVGETRSRRKNPGSTCASDAVGKEELDEMPNTSPTLYCTGTISGLLLYAMFSPVQFHLYPGRGAQTNREARRKELSFCVIVAPSWLRFLVFRRTSTAFPN